jgi:hypothetical protein
LGAGPNPYESRNNAPTDYVDPSGLQDLKDGVPAIGKEVEVGNNKYGTFFITMNQLRNAKENTSGMTVTIRFEPNRKEVNSTEIAFVQVARIVYYDSLKPIYTSKAEKNRAVAGGFALDRFDKRKFGWYGLNDDNTYVRDVTTGKCPEGYRSAVMTDSPDLGNEYGKVRFEFVTAVIAKAGPDKRKIYGAVNWNFWRDANGDAHPYGVELLNQVPQRWIDSVINWNSQATDLFRWERNSKSQEPLGPFDDVDLSGRDMLPEGVTGHEF